MVGFDTHKSTGGSVTLQGKSAPQKLKDSHEPCCGGDWGLTFLKTNHCTSHSSTIATITTIATEKLPNHRLFLQC